MGSLEIRNDLEKLFNAWQRQMIDDTWLEGEIENTPKLFLLNRITDYIQQMLDGAQKSCAKVTSQTLVKKKRGRPRRVDSIS
jgi:hypothetical protein